MDRTAFIFARSGSKGLPGKNIKDFSGKPLIAWSIQQALGASEISRVIVSTDSEEIAEIARKNGATVPFIRPKQLAEDTSAEWLSWQHALKFLIKTEGYAPEALISVPTTAPLRISKDISDCIEIYEQGKYDSVVTITESHRNPYFNMLKKSDEGFELVIPNSNGPMRRQDAKPVYDMTTVCYVVNSEFILMHDNIFEGRIGAHLVPIDRAIDIDTPRDFRIAEILFDERELK